MLESDDEHYTIPVQDQRVFGAGIKRKRVPFVPASSTTAESHNSRGRADQSASQRYLSIVGVGLDTGGSVADATGATERNPPPVICDICSQPIAGGDATAVAPHESSLAHQVCLEHSHGASHIDRTTKGYSYLRAYGWDPDSRQGLGSAGEGRLHPIKPKEKHDTVGLGVELKKTKRGKSVEKARKLNAKQVREQEEVGRRRRADLNRMFTASDDVLRYLGALG